MTFTLWANEENDEFTFIQVLGDGRFDATDPRLRLIKTFEADSYDDAMRQYYEFMGWKPYQPLT